MAFAHRFAWLFLALLANPLPAAAPLVQRVDRYGDPLPAGAVARLGTLRWRQLASAVQLVFTPDGRFLLGSGAGPLVVWDVATGRIIRRLDDPSINQVPPFARFVLSADGKTLVSQNANGQTLFWWDLASGRRLAMSAETESVARGPSQLLHILAVSPDGQHTAVGVRGGMQWRKHSESVMLLFDRPGEKAVRRLRFPDEQLQSLAFSSDGKWVIGLFLGSDRFIVRRIEMNSGRIQQTLPIREVIQARLSSDGSCIAVYDEAEELSILDSATGKKRKLGSARDLAGHELSFAAQDRVLLAFMQDRPLVQRFDTRTGKKLSPIRTGVQLGRWVNCLALSPDGKTLALANGPSAIALVDVETGKRRDRLPGLKQDDTPGFAHPTAQIAFSADGRFITTLSAEDGLARWDPTTGRQLAHVPAGRVDSVLRGTGVLSHGGERLIQAKWRTIEILTLPSGKRSFDWRIPESADGSMAVSPDDKTLAMFGKDGILRFWELPRGKLIGEATPDRKLRVRLRMLFTHDGRSLALVNGPHQVELWQVPSGRSAGVIHSYQDHSALSIEHWDTCFSNDGRRLYSGFGRLLQAWDVRERLELNPMMSELGRAFASDRGGSLAISADGRFLARTDGEGTLALVETASGQVMHRFSGLHGKVAFAPTGWRLAAEDRVSVTIPVFDLPLLVLSLTPPSTEQASVETLWADLAHIDAARAQQAAWRMTRLTGVETFLAGKLNPVSPAVGKRVAALISALGSDEFDSRNKAEEALAGMRDSVRKALEDAQQRETDLEIKHRLRRVLGIIRAPSPQSLQELRALMVLEARATPAARQLLRRLAGGLADARLTEEAASALRRLELINAKRAR
jgi:WD40 repeat protein